MSARAWGATCALGLILLLGPLAWNPDLAQLDALLMRLGALAFGGGFTLIPLIQHSVVDRSGVLTLREFIDGVALGQVTPGPILITATFVGYRVGGVVGAVTSTAAVFLPSFVVLMAALPRFDRIKRLPIVTWMVHGVLAAFIALLAFVLIQFGHASLVDWKTWALAAGAAIALWRGVDLLVIVGGAVAVALLAL